MKKYKISFFISILLLLVIGCDKTNEPAPINTQQSRCPLVTITTKDVITTYTYSSDKVVSLSYSYPKDPSATRTIEFSYDSKGNTIRIEEKGKFYYTYTYNGNDKPIREERFSSSMSGYRDYEYNSNGQLIKTRNYNEENSGVITDEYTIYEYGSGTDKNRLRDKTFSKNNKLLYSQEYEYDVKKSPFTDVVINRLPEPANNIIKKIQKDEVGGSTYTTVYTYKYNENDLPIEVTSKQTSSGSTSSFTETTSYTYNCK